MNCNLIAAELVVRNARGPMAIIKGQISGVNVERGPRRCRDNVRVSGSVRHETGANEGRVGQVEKKGRLVFPKIVIRIVGR